MSDKKRQILYVALGILLIAGCAWWWFSAMEKKWVAREGVSAAAQANPMLAATQLLTRHRHTVTVESTLGETLLQPLPRGTLLLAENNGMVTPQQSRQLLAWVREGNTLIARPKWSERERYDTCDHRADINRKEDNEKRKIDLTDPDPISDYLGVALVRMTTRPEKEAKEKEEPDEPKVPAKAPATTPEKSPETSPKKAPPKPGAGVCHVDPPCLARLTLPNAGYALRLDADAYSLASTEHSRAPLFSDDAEVALRVYTEGKGHIVLFSNDYFDNDNLGRYDHAELLLALGALSRNAPVVIVQRLDMPSWYQAFWWHFQLGVISLGCGLLLLFWSAVRRFGPMLPEPERERRSLMEHIDASGRWLWKLPGGRDILLAAARDATNKVLQRRAPELQRVSPVEQIRLLARFCKLGQDDVASALRGPASRLPIKFTRQIQTLQQMRKHYER